MLSRTAESFFWIGRYIERAEYTARFANVQYHLILETADVDDQMEAWRLHLDSTGELAFCEEIYQAFTTRNVMEFLTLTPANANSLLNLIKAARMNARGIQDQLSSEVWDHVNEFYLELKNKTAVDLWASPYQFLSDIYNTCYTLDGVFGSTMTHDEGWNFYRLGKNVERAGGTARLLDHPVLAKATVEPGAISEYHDCLAILKSASAFEAYRKFYSAQLIPRNIVQFLLLYNHFPRSVRFSASLISRLLGRLSGPGQRPETREIGRLAGQLAADLEFASLDEVYRVGLTEFLTQVIHQLDHLTNEIGKAFFRSSGYSDLPPPVTRKARRPVIHVHEPTLRVVKSILAARHQFTYQYFSPISQVSTVVRLAPPQHYGRQRRLDLRWHIDPSADYRHFTDAFGNLVWQLDHTYIEKEIHCVVEMRIETQASYLPDHSLFAQGVTPQESDCTVQPAEFTHLTTLVNSSDALFQIAKRSKERGLSASELADSFLDQVFAHMRYQQGSTDVGTTASQAFEKGAGVCQDYTHIMLSLCRQADLPARYVSGYLPGEGQMHAWLEVLLPLGSRSIPTWVAYDPTHHCRCDERYITVAIGRDYQDVAPTSGYYSGTSHNTLSVDVSVVMETQGTSTKGISTQMIVQETVNASHESQQQ